MSNLQDINRRIEKIKRLLGNPSRKIVSKSDIQIKKYEDAANAIAEYDPEQAMKWMDQADRLRQSTAELDFKTAQALLKIENPTKSEVSRFEQLWKDLERSKREALSKYGETSIYYTKPAELQMRVEEKLKQLSPEVWSGKPSENLTASDITTPDVPTDETSTIDSSAQYDELKQSITEGAVDKNNDGVLDISPTILRNKVNETASKLGWGPEGKEVKALYELIDGLAREAKDREEKRYLRGLSAIERKQKLDDAVADNGPLLYAIDRLKSHPNDIAVKSSAITSVLRIESGAAIADSEFSRRMVGLLGNDNYRNMLNEMTGAGMIIKGMLSKDLKDASFEQIFNKYLDRVPAEEISDFVRTFIPSYVIEHYKSLNKSTPKPTKSTPKPKREDYKLLTEWKNAVKDWERK